jgi:hypothetical protein
MKNLFLGILLMLLLTTCVDPYDPKLVGGEKYLVFEGTLTDAPSPYRFALTFSAGYNSTESVYETRVKGAQIWVTDQEGTRTDFVDDGKGNFDSPLGFRGQVGRTYTLTVAYKGHTYHSDPETLRPVPPIDMVYTSFRKITTRGTSYNGEFLIYLDVNDPVGENYYQWDWVHYYRPIGCVLENKVWKPCCTRCWNIVKSAGDILIATDRLVDGGRLTGQKIGAAPNDDSRPYYLRIGQQSLSLGAYQYWLAVRNLTSNVGSVFDIPPSSLVGNLREETTGGRPILRYFQVSARTEKIMYINRFQAPLLPFAPTSWPFSSICEPCQESLYRTRTQPEGWVE